MNPNEPRESFPSDAQIASFLDEATTEMLKEQQDAELAKVTYNRILQDEALTIINQALERFDYRPPEQYDTALKEQYLLKEASQILQLYQDCTRTGLTTTQAEIFNNAKKRLFAIGAITYELPTERQIFAILEEILPGEMVDFHHENMNEFSLEALEVLANTNEYKLRWSEFHNGLRGLVESFNTSADEDFDRMTSESLTSFSNDVVVLLNSKTVTTLERAQLLEELAVSSPFGYELAQNIIDYTKSHKHLLE